MRRGRGAPGIGSAPLQMVQLIATCAGVLPPCAPHEAQQRLHRAQPVVGEHGAARAARLHAARRVLACRAPAGGHLTKRKGKTLECARPAAHPCVLG